MTALLFWQDTAAGDNGHLLVIFVGVIAFCSFVQFLVLVGAGIAALKVKNSLMKSIEELKGKATPVIASVRGIVDDATPKVRTVSDNVVRVSNIVRSKVEEFEVTVDEANQTVKDANRRTQAQVARVDGMINSGLTSAGEVAASVHHGITQPFREISGVLNGLKAGLDVLTGKRATPPRRSGSALGQYSRPGATSTVPAGSGARSSYSGGSQTP